MQATADSQITRDAEADLRNDNLQVRASGAPVPKVEAKVSVTTTGPCLATEHGRSYGSTTVLGLSVANILTRYCPVELAKGPYCHQTTERSCQTERVIPPSTRMFWPVM